jgi:hypothetical protein
VDLARLEDEAARRVDRLEWQQRQRNLQRIVNNGRFLILPWVRVQGLASKILALSARRLPLDWQSYYGHRPLLMETLVDTIVFAELAIEQPTGSTWDKPPVVVAWTGGTRPTGKPTKTFASTRWSVMPGNDSAAIPPGNPTPLQFEGRLGPYAKSYSFRNRSYKCLQRGEISSPQLRM